MMRLPPIPPSYSPSYAKPNLTTRQSPYYYYPGVPYRQGEEDLQQQVVCYAPNQYYYGYGSNSAGGGTSGSSYWRSNYMQPNDQSHYSYGPYSTFDSPSFSAPIASDAGGQLKLLEQKKLQARKMEEQVRQQKNVAEKIRLEKAKPTTSPALNKPVKGNASTRGGFGPSANSFHASAAA
jgi:hypothetical protein